MTVPSTAGIVSGAAKPQLTLHAWAQSLGIFVIALLVPISKGSCAGLTENFAYGKLLLVVIARPAVQFQEEFS